MTYGWSILIVTAVLVISSTWPLQLGELRATGAARELQGPEDCGGFTNLETTCSGVPPQSVAVINRLSTYYITQNPDHATGVHK